MILEQPRVMWIRRVMLWASLVGLIVSTYLSITYLTNAPIVCGIVKGCDIVRSSSWATSFGIPRPLLGVVFYASIIGLLIWRTVYPHRLARRAYHLSMVAVTIGFIESAFLTFVQAFELKAYCIWCLASAAMATVIFAIAWWDRPGALEEREALQELKVQFWSFAVAVIAGGFLIFGLMIPRTNGEPPRLEPAASDPAEEARVRSLLYPQDLVYEGPATATVTVIEFIDFQCPACKEAHREVLAMRETYRGRIRFAFRHFPLPTHKDAAGAALGAACAADQGKIFPYVDILMANQQALAPSDLIRYADSIGLDTTAFRACLADPSTKALVERDIKDARALGVSATPTFFINTTFVEGLPTAKQLGELIDQEIFSG